MSDLSLRRILHSDLNFHPFKIMVSQELSPADYANRQNLCEQMLAQITPNAAFFSSDEAHFHLSGAVNKQNFRSWDKNNPQNYSRKTATFP
jgi:hypothetical protein